MLEVTIALCPPEGERSVLVTGKIENVTPGNQDVADYMATFRCDGVDIQFLVRKHAREFAAALLIERALGAFNHHMYGPRLAGAYMAHYQKSERSGAETLSESIDAKGKT